MNVSVSEMVVQLVVSLAVVIGMIWLLAKFLSLRSKWLYRHRPLKVLGGVGLGPQKSLQIVEIGGVLYVLGIGQDVTLLRVIDDADEKERIMQDFNVSKEGKTVPFFGRKPDDFNRDFTSILNRKLHAMRAQREQTLKEWLHGREERSAEREITD